MVPRRKLKIRKPLLVKKTLLLGLCLGLLSSEAALAQGSKNPVTKAQLKAWVKEVESGFDNSFNGAGRKLTSAGPAAVPHLLERLTDPSCRNVQKIETVLGFLGQDSHASATLIKQAWKQPQPVIELRFLRLIRTLRDEHAELMVPKLIAALSSPDTRVCKEAAISAQRYGGRVKAGAPKLKKLLMHSDAEVRAEAISALVRVAGAKPYLDELRGLLIDSHGPVRLNALSAVISALRRAREKRPLLRAALKDKAKAVKLYACRALRSLKAGAEAATDDLLKLCQDQDQALKEQALLALGPVARYKQDKSAVLEQLIKHLDAKDHSIRSAAAHSLSDMGHGAKEALPELIGLLHRDLKKYSYAAMHAANALGRIGESERSIPALRKAYKVAQGPVKSAIKDALERLGVKPEADAKPTYDKRLAPLYESLAVKNRYFHKEAISEVAKGGAEVVPFLIKSWQGEGYRVKRLIVKVLAKIGREHKEALPILAAELQNSFSGHRVEFLNIFIDIGPAAKPVLPQLIEASQDKDPGVRWAAYQVLGHLGPESLPRLIELFKSKDLYRQRGAANALAIAKGDSKELRAVLIEKASHPDDKIRESVARAFANKDSEVLPALTKLVRDKIEVVRWWACMSLATHKAKGKEAVPALLTLISKEKSGRVLEQAIKALSIVAVKNDKASEALAKVFTEKTPPEAGEALFQALPAMGAKVEVALPALKRGFKKLKSRYGWAVLEALKHYGKDNDEAYKLLLSALEHKDPYVRGKVLKRLTDLPSRAKESLPEVDKHLSDDDGWVRIQARSTAEALRKALAKGGK